MSFRVGLGIDFHRYRQGRKLILGGVLFDYPMGLFGHSDADVVAHAAADAVLGACKLGDIGKHFPDTDPAYKGANSIELLKKCADMARAKGFGIGNMDIMVVLEEPRISPRIAEMEKNLAKALGVDTEEVSVKATKPERMGTVGKKEGVACYAVCMVEKK
jgi:2-C-methyl-D-erythritol 2,4-cyclodiphosphate synthase